MLLVTSLHHLMFRWKDRSKKRGNSIILKICHFKCTVLLHSEMHRKLTEYNTLEENSKCSYSIKMNYSRMKSFIPQWHHKPGEESEWSSPRLSNSYLMATIWSQILCVLDTSPHLHCIKAVEYMYICISGQPRCSLWLNMITKQK